MKSSAGAQKEFSPRLEALRGVAALMVALGHSVGVVQPSSAIDWSIRQFLSVLGNGGAGVAIFFVLSGHVLGLSLSRLQVHPLAYAPMFVWRRVLRIYPAVTGVLIVCWLYVAFLHERLRFAAASAAYQGFWGSGASGLKFVRDWLFIDNYLDPVTWTLQVEMLAGFCLPFFFYLKQRSSVGAALLLSGWVAFFVVSPLYSYARLGFVFMVFMGLYVVELRALLERSFKTAGRLAIVLVALAACCASKLLATQDHPVHWMIVALAAMFLIAALSGIPADRRVAILDTAPARLLGRVSYSFYLWHMPILYAVATFFFSVVDNAWILAFPNTSSMVLFLVSSAAAVLVARLSYHWLERPFKGGWVWGARAVAEPLR